MTRSWDKAVQDKKSGGMTRGPSAPRQARKIEPGSCPAGYDPDVWGLAGYLESRAAQEGIQLTVGRPVIHALLEPRCTELREVYAVKAKTWSVTGTEEATWQEIVHAAIDKHFTEVVEDSHAADWFCGPVIFRATVKEVRQRGYMRHLASLAKEEYEND